MEDQGKRLLLAVLVAFGIMLLWDLLLRPDPPPEKKPDQPAEISKTDNGGQKQEPSPGPDSGKALSVVEPDKAPAAVQAERGAEQLFTFDFPNYRATFTSYGGTLKSWELMGEKYQYREGEAIRQMDLVRTKEEELLPFAVRFDKMDRDQKTEWRGEKKNSTEIVFRWDYQVTTPEGNRVVAFELVKTYKLYPEDYLLELTIDVVNKASTEERQTVIVSLYGYQDLSEDTEGGWTRVDSSWKSACYVDGELSTASAHSLSEGGKKLHSSRSVGWGGFLHSYFLFAVAPRVETAAELGCNSYGVEDHPGAMRTDIVLPEVNIRRGGPNATHVLVAYIGPKYLDKLEAIPAAVHFDPRFGESIDLGWFGFIARPMLWLLQWFHSFLGNWGLAIIFLTILVKAATLYWTNKSMRSMKKMASLRPQIEALQKKYKDDKQRQQVEMMNLYKANNVNPLAGCLPIVLQMPIWFALYRMLMAAAELYHAPFIPGWINDLTSPDPYYILPVALIILMFVQAKLSPSTGDSAQQKVLTYGLPLMFGVFSFFFPAGLTVYISTNTILTAVHSVWMNRDELRKKRRARLAGASGEAGQGKSSTASEKMSARKAARSEDKETTSASDSDESKPGPGHKKTGGQGKPMRGPQKRGGGKRKRNSGNKS